MTVNNTPNTNNTNNISDTNVSTSRLVAARDAKDFVITPPQIDVRGWNLMGPSETKLGTVDRIMLDRTEMKPRYLLLSLADGGQHLLLPIGVARLDRKQKFLRLDGITPDVFRAIPRLSSDVVTNEFEQRVFSTLSADKTDAWKTSTEPYAHAMYDANSFFTGEVSVHTS